MRNRHTMRRVIALATVIGTLAAPTAWAAPFEERVPSSTVNEGSATGQVQAESYSPSAAPPQSPTVAGDGFSWGDAGIGAAAMVALAAIAAGALVVTGHRGSRQTVA